MSDELLAELVNEVRALRSAVVAAIERKRHVRPISKADAMIFSTLLPAINAALPNEIFSIRLLHDYGALNASKYIALRDALSLAGNPRKLGRLFRRGAASDIPGFRITAVGQSSEGKLWNIEEVVNRTIETHKKPCRTVTGRAYTV